jgi:hypothetical protein
MWGRTPCSRHEVWSAREHLQNEQRGHLLYLATRKPDEY